MNNSNHIHVYGFLDVNSEQFVQIAKHVTFYLFPSASEGGAPGSVIAAMKCGIIPIVSKYASFDEIEELGYRLDDFSIRSIEDAVKWSESLCEQQVERLIKANFDYAQKKWNINVFSKEFEYLLKEKIKCYMDEGDNA
ncbi:glycosyltransferase [Bacteroides fragilis]